MLFVITIIIIRIPTTFVYLGDVGTVWMHKDWLENFLVNLKLIMVVVESFRNHFGNRKKNFLVINEYRVLNDS